MSTRPVSVTGGKRPLVEKDLEMRGGARPPAKSLFGWLWFLQLVPVLSFEPMTGREFGTSLVVLPNLVVTSLAWLAVQSALLKDVAFRVAIQLQEPRFLAAIPTVGQNDQYLSLHSLQTEENSVPAAPSQSFWTGRAKGISSQSEALCLGRPTIRTKILSSIEKRAVRHRSLAANVADFVSLSRVDRDNIKLEALIAAQGVQLFGNVISHEVEHSCFSEILGKNPCVFVAAQVATVAVPQDHMNGVPRAHCSSPLCNPNSLTWLLRMTDPACNQILSARLVAGSGFVCGAPAVRVRHFSITGRINPGATILLGRPGAPRRGR